MRKKPQRLLSILLAIVLTAGIFITAPLTAVAAGANDNPVLISGNCGVGEDSDVTFYCFKDGSMGIFGKGAIRDYELTADGMSTAPWYSDMLTLSNTLIMKKFAVERGVTRIGSYSFYFPKAALPPYITLFAQLYNIDIADTVTSIGEYAFYNQSMEEIMIPPSVKSIGYNAFGGMANLKKLTYFGDPTTLQWGTQEGDAEFPNGITCHVLKIYESQLTDINRRFAGKGITFVADMDNPYEHADNVDRNIAVYYGSANTNVLGGAAPYIIVGRFDKSKKSVTHGSNGFASCVKYDDKYYLLTDNATGALNEANINETTGKVEFKNKQTYNPTPISFLKLQITHQYVGSNTVKMIYTLTNTGSTALNNIMVGGTGDIKIGADDFAAINPLMEDDKQVGFYMKSTKDFDKSESNEYATLGFIAKNVKIVQSEDATAENTYPEANFFYGEVDAAKKNSAAGAKTMALIPERVFSMNSGKSHDTGTFDESKDSGMSYYWNVETLQPGNENKKQFAVLFSVYGASSDKPADSIINESKSDDTAFVQVQWKDYDDTLLLTQLVKPGETPVYPLENPTRASDGRYHYTFSGWEKTGENTYKATYNQVEKEKLFVGHSLTLDGDIGLNFYLNVTPDQINTGSGVVVDFSWRVRGENKTAQAKLETGKNKTVTIDGTAKTVYLARINLPAAEMAYNIHATATINGVLQYETNDYSVKEYGEARISLSDDDSEKTLLKEMLNYGARSQDAFDRKDVPYANADIAGYEMRTSFGEDKTFEQAVADAVSTENSDAEKSDMRSGTADFGLTYIGSSQIFLTKTTLRHYYIISDQGKFDTAKTQTPGLFNDTDKPPFVFVDFTEIPSDKLDQLQSFTVGDHTYLFSVLDYAVAMYKGGNDDEKNLAMSIYWYNQAANDYFSTIGE